MEFEGALAQIPVTDRGSSLASMKRCLVSRGLDFETVSATEALLENVTRPFIVHLNTSSGRNTGHYVVVLAAQQGEVLMLDPSSKVYLVTNTATFSNQWSGYALVPRASVPASFTGVRLLIAVCTLVAGALVAFLAISLLKRKNRLSRLASVGPLIAIFAFLGCSRSSDSVAGGTQGLRTIGPSTANLGLILPGQTRKHTFRVRNDSTQTIDLAVGDISCGCATAELNTNRISRGQSTSMTLEVRGGGPGPKKASAMVFGTTANRRSESLRVEVQAVVGGLEVKPEVLRIVPSPSGSGLAGTGLIELYTDDANDVRLLGFIDESEEGERVPLRCTFGQAKAHVLDEGTHLTVPISLQLEVAPSDTPGAHYRRCRLTLGRDEDKFKLGFLVWVDSPPDYQVSPEGLVVRISPVGHGVSAGAATLRIEAREGLPDIDSLTVHCDAPAIVANVRGTNVEVEYSGPPLEDALSTKLVLSSPKFRHGHQEVPLIVLPQR